MSGLKNYVVRLARKGDATHLAEVEQSASDLFLTIADLAWIADAPPTAHFDHLAAISSGTMWVVVDDTNAIAGFLLGEVCGEDLHICELSVHALHQRRGVGASLIEAAAGFARHQRLVCLTLTTFRDVPWNAPYYERLGFTVIDRVHFDARLHEVFVREMRIGLPVDRRCAMSLMLSNVT